MTLASVLAPDPMTVGSVGMEKAAVLAGLADSLAPVVVFEGLTAFQQQRNLHADALLDASMKKFCPPSRMNAVPQQKDVTIAAMPESAEIASHVSPADEPEAEPEAQATTRRPVKLIFLDIDGPMAPCKGLKKHPFSPEETSNDKPYDVQFRALCRIVEECGGPDIVKVVISSNWRTMPERITWLEAQFREIGVELVGHTDVMHLHPARLDQEAASRRVMEIHRVLSTSVVGEGGPYSPTGKSGEDKDSFRKRELPSDWDVVSWIAIDDLNFDNVPEDVWEEVKFYSAFITLPTDNIGKRWIRPPAGFSEEMQNWNTSFRENHLVQVSPYCGLANTPGALQKAIDLLNAK
mmetsp:Transcript_46371/g.110427  ORF Transcript_46371/g.110427 Transcript_46371/m.110427 type:complete len:350 (+) Transcript_46371:67-1116(+)